MVPRGKRLASVAAGEPDRATSTSSHRSRAQTPAQAEGVVDEEIEAALLEALRGLSVAESSADRPRKEAFADGITPHTTRESISAATQRVARVLDKAQAAVQASKARAGPLVRVPTLERMQARLKVRRARTPKSGSVLRAPIPSTTSSSSSSAAGGGGDAAAEGKEGEEATESTELPLESLSGLFSALQLGLHARMRTNAEQEAIRREFERTVSDRIREARASEGLLLDEKRRMEMQFKDEEDRLEEALSKHELELKDLQAADERRQKSLAAAVQARENELMTAAGDQRAALRDDLGNSRTALADEREQAAKREQALRKNRNGKMRDLGTMLQKHDEEMAALQRQADRLEADNEELERHCAALQAHSDLLQRNRQVLQEQVLEVAERAQHKARELHELQVPAKRRIVDWFRRLKRKWDDERKAKGKSSKKRR